MRIILLVPLFSVPVRNGCMQADNRNVRIWQFTVLDTAAVPAGDGQTSPLMDMDEPDDGEATAPPAIRAPAEILAEVGTPDRERTCSAECSVLF
jgi:hypothetical protein